MEAKKNTVSIRLNGSAGGVEEFERIEGDAQLSIRESNPILADVRPSGLTVCNVTMTEQLTELGRVLGLAPGEFLACVNASEKTGMVSVHAVPLGTPGADAIRYPKHGKRATLYLHRTFRQKPLLRPGTRKSCAAVPATDSEGNPCLVINLAAGLEKHTTPRASKGPAGK